MNGQVPEGAATVGTADVETCYVRRGEGSPIVFVHGAIMDHRMWEPQVAALADEFTTVAYDVRGHGWTGGSGRATYTVDRYVEDLRSLLAALDVERPVLCGLSLGGCVAQAFAATYPDDVAGVVLADTFGPWPLDPSGRLVFATLRLFAALDRVVGYRRLNRVQLRVGNLLKPGVAGDETTVQRLVDEGPTIPNAEFRKIVGSVVAFPGSDLDVSRIEAPTLVLYGERSPSFLHRQARRLAAAIPDATLTAVPGAGHAANLDNPEFFTDAVRDFARRVMGAGTDTGWAGD